MRSERVRPGRVGLHLVLGGGALLMIVPFAWMVISSLKNRVEITAYPPVLLPTEWLWRNYPEAMDAAPFDVYFRNSLLIGIGHTVINLALATMAGYVLARVPFRG